MKDREGKRGSRSVDLPVRASSSSVARLLLLGADQRSTLRGAPSPIRGGYSAVRRFPNQARPAGAPTGKPSPVSSPLFRAFRSFSSPLFFPEFLSSNSFPASSPFLSPSVSILLAHRLVRRSFSVGGSLGEGGCSSVVKFSSLVAAMPRCEPLYYNP